MVKRIMIFVEGTTFYTKFPMFLFSKYGYKPKADADVVKQKKIAVKDRIHWDKW